MRRTAASLFFAALALPAAVVPHTALAIEPEQREVVVVSGRVWEGSEYQETFVPSTAERVTLIGGEDSALSFVRTLEYYWPLSRQVYVDFERQRDLVEGELVVRRDGAELSRLTMDRFSIVYPEGAINGNGRLVWGEEAASTYAAYREEEARFAREYAAARQAHTAYEQRLLAAGAAQGAGAAVSTIQPPPPLPEPSLRLVTAPQPAFRLALEAGDYRIALEADGAVVPGTERELLVIPLAGTEELVADIVPEERWTRPLPANAGTARIYARPGATFYVTLAEANQFAEEDYVPVVRPQAEVVPGRPVWIRRRPATIETLDLSWAGAAEAVSRQALKVEQTRGASFGYVVRPAAGGETPDLEAFTVEVPDDPAVTRGFVEAAADQPFERELIVVQPRQAALSLALALVPLLGVLLTLLRLRRRPAAARPAD